MSVSEIRMLPLPEHDDVLPFDRESTLLQTDAEQIYITETPTGLTFAADTPMEVWGGLVTRLQRQQKVIEWALADAINFGEVAFGEDHTQWVDETGLSKRTLQNIARIGRLIDPARRRADVSFSHHAEVASLPVPDQESLLDAAESQGMTRYDLRDAVRERRKQLEGGAVTPRGDEVEMAELPWVPTIDDLAPSARQWVESRAPLGRLRTTWISAALATLVWTGDASNFLPGRWRP